MLIAKRMPDEVKGAVQKGYTIEGPSFQTLKKLFSSMGIVGGR
jgi:hypothetical protein